MASTSSSTTSSTLTSTRQQQHDNDDDVYHDDDDYYDNNDYPYELEGLLKLEQTYYPPSSVSSSPLRIHEDSSNRSRLYQWCTNILQFLKIPNEQQSIMLWTIGYFVDGYMSLILQNSSQNDDDSSSSSFQRKSSFLYQLVMATSLNLVIKLHCAGKEGDPTESPSTKFLVYLPLFLKGKAISVEQMSHMEMLLLRQYTFRVHPPTPICFIRDILQHCCGKTSSEEGTINRIIEEHAIELSMMWLEHCYEQVHCDNDDNDNDAEEEAQHNSLSSLPSPSRLALACVMNAVYYYYNTREDNNTTYNAEVDTTNPANEDETIISIQRQDNDNDHHQHRQSQQQRSDGDNNNNERRAIVVIPASSPSVVTSVPTLHDSHYRHHHLHLNTNTNEEKDDNVVCQRHPPQEISQEQEITTSNQLRDEQQAHHLQETLDEMLPFFIKVQTSNHGSCNSDQQQQDLNQLRTQLWNMYWTNMKQQRRQTTSSAARRRASENVSASSSATSSTASSTTTGGSSRSTRSYHST